VAGVAAAVVGEEADVVAVCREVVAAIPVAAEVTIRDEAAAIQAAAEPVVTREVRGAMEAEAAATI
jgi:hypothetical protein